MDVNSALILSQRPQFLHLHVIGDERLSERVDGQTACGGRVFERFHWTYAFLGLIPIGAGDPPHGVERDIRVFA